MLVKEKIAQVLEERREAFSRAVADAAKQQERYLEALDQLSRLSSADIGERLGDEPWPGARPTPELDDRGLVVRFAEHWNSAQEARAWALERLHGISTVAVDGSQIPASKEFGVPVSLVQVAWFENPHDSGQPYRKDVCHELVTPGDREDEIEASTLWVSFAESKLNQRRFALEMRVAVERIHAIQGDPPPVVLVDGSFVLSFIGRMAPQARSAYLEALFGLLNASRECRVPVLGYVDLSFASDLLTMLSQLFDLSAGNLFDARVLAQRMDSFDRTAAFQCARGDVLPHYQTPEQDHSKELCFLYLKTGHDRLPARIDFPRWILEAGLLDQVIDAVRAEVVVGSGYPYALETADAAAVLTAEDRMSFFRLFHEFAKSSGIELSVPGKSISKLHRR
jgi:hypothetical protein